jgi:hypothetical protein
MIGTALGALLAVGMFGLGAGACVAPRSFSSLYGAPQWGAGGLALVRAAGLRDLGLAGILAVLLAMDPVTAAIPAACAAAVAAGDLINVLTLRRRQGIPLATHLTGVAVGVAAAALLALRV